MRILELLCHHGRALARMRAGDQGVDLMLLGQLRCDRAETIPVRPRGRDDPDPHGSQPFFDFGLILPRFLGFKARMVEALAAAALAIVAFFDFAIEVRTASCSASNWASRMA